MIFDTFLKTYISPRGHISKRIYFAGLIIAFIVTLIIAPGKEDANWQTNRWKLVNKEKV